MSFTYEFVSLSLPLLVCSGFPRILSRPRFCLRLMRSRSSLFGTTRRPVFARLSPIFVSQFSAPESLLTSIYLLPNSPTLFVSVFKARGKGSLLVVFGVSDVNSRLFENSGAPTGGLKRYCVYSPKTAHSAGTMGAAVGAGAELDGPAPEESCGVPVEI